MDQNTNNWQVLSNISQEGKPKHQSSLSSFFIKSDPQPVKSETPPEKSVGASESTVKNCAWTLKQMTTKAEIIATLQYTDQNTPFASADNLGSLLPATISGFTNSKECCYWTWKDVLCCWAWTWSLFCKA